MHPVHFSAQRTTAASVLLADSNLLSVELLSGALKRCQSSFEIAAISVTSTEAIRKLDEFKPDIGLISVDLQDGETAGYRVLLHIKEHYSKMAAIALQNRAQHEQVVEAFRCGARGVISRDKTFRLLVKCIRKVYEGGIWASPDQIDFVFEALKKDSPTFPKRAMPSILRELTPREKDVAALVIEGFRNAEIGTKLNVSEHTVRNYIMRIYDKLGVSNRVQLTRQCADAFGRPATSTV